LQALGLTGAPKYHFLQAPGLTCAPAFETNFQTDCFMMFIDNGMIPDKMVWYKQQFPRAV